MPVGNDPGLAERLLAQAATPNPLGALVERSAAAWPSAIAFELELDDGTTRSLDFGTLHIRVATAAAELRRRGVRAADAVLLSGANDLNFVVSWLAIVHIGAIVVPLPIVSAAAEVAARALATHARLLLHDRERSETASTARDLGDHLDLLSLDELAAADSATATGEGPPASAEAVGADAPAMILFTSGTTGTPRGAIISHRTLALHTTLLACELIGLGADDRILGVLPLTHSYGARMVLLATLVSGARTLLVPRFDAARTLEQMIRHRTTWIPAVPTMFAAWGSLAKGRRPKLRWCLSAGAPLADEILHRAEARLDTTIRQAYGMTEATLATLDAPPQCRTIGSVGRVVPGVEVKLINTEGLEVPPGQRGEILIRGHNLMSGYLDDTQASQDALQDGWMHSGDVGCLAADGLLCVVDRIKDMIIRGGNNVYPSEVEAVLAEHPGVREAAVVGRPDPWYGEEIVAFLVPTNPADPPDPGDLERFCRSRLARTKVPREWHIVEAFPLGPSRKILKRELRARLDS